MLGQRKVDGEIHRERIHSTVLTVDVASNLHDLYRRLMLCHKGQCTSGPYRDFAEGRKAAR